jgi:ribosomal protein S18 acetylase RimI-like enzyme
MFRERLCAGVRHLFRRHRKRQQPCDLVAPASFGILALAVHPAFQGLGVGKRLMRHMEQSARVKGFVEMNLTVNPDNVRGIGFYTEQHWARVFDNGHWTGSMKKQLIPRGVNG